MKNPLNKRLPREFRKDFGKYLVIFLLLVITIGFVSVFLVADGSMIKAYTEGIDNYNTENGHFRTSEKMNDAQIQSVEENGIRIYNNFYLEQDLTNGSTMRIFANREQVNLACLMEGEFPKAANEIAIDRMYADNNKISIGDTLKSDTQSWKVTGFIALPDYSCLFQNNNDSMFDSVKFGVAIVAPEEFETLDQEKLRYNYAWIYAHQSKDEKEEKKVSEDLVEDIGKVVTLEAFVPRYLNQAIMFTGDDMGGDRAMVITLLYIVIVIMAFVFGIFTLFYYVIDGVQIQVQFVTVLSSPAAGTVQITGTGRIHKNQPRDITVIFLTHFTDCLCSVKCCLISQIQCSLTNDIWIQFINHVVDIFYPFIIWILNHLTCSLIIFFLEIVSHIFFCQIYQFQKTFFTIFLHMF